MNHPSTSRARILALTFVAILAAVAVTGCGSDDKESSSASGNGVDRAFVEEMIPHHKSAIEMAEIAQQRSQRPQIKELAQNIIDSQTKELTTLTTAQAALAKEGVAKGDLGVPAHETGMDMDTASLKTADPFDRAFIDMMVPHHQGAVRMARVQLAKGSDPELKKLAQEIIAEQAREIGEMNQWRTTYYGAASPAGGVPAEGAAAAPGATTPAPGAGGKHGGGHSG